MMINIVTTIKQGTEHLKACSDSATLDSQLLLAFVLNKPTSYLLTWPEVPLTEIQYTKFLTLITRRKAGEPIAYILGEKEFWSLSLYVSPATLIPRPDTEILVESVLEAYPESSLNCLDLGTGTGAIALALASEKPLWQIDAIDFKHEAILLAIKNKQKYALENVTIFQSDWFNQIPENKQYQLIVTNPPYIDERDPHLVEGDVRFEPSSALIAKQQGLADIKHIVKTAKAYLCKQGALYIEHGYQQAAAVREILSADNYDCINTIKDLSGNDRVTSARYLK